MIKTVLYRILFVTFFAMIFMFITGLVWIVCGYIFVPGYFKEKTKTQLVQPPNYDKEAVLNLMEKGECVGGTIQEGKFSVFVCKN